VNVLSVLRDLKFGQRVAEEEGEALAAYFVETDHWRRLYADEVDVVYGPKGAGKSALYSLLISRAEGLFDRQILLAVAENPRGAPAFKDLVLDPPASELEFIALWKLYFACLVSDTFDKWGVSGDAAKRVRAVLQSEGLIRGARSLQGLLRAVVEYVRAAIRPEAVEAGVNIDPHTQLPVGFSGKITFREPDAAATKSGVASVDELIRLCNDALTQAGYTLWLLLDRLDVAFADSEELEHNSLRALFKVYLDFLAHPSIRLKIFLRTDIWRRITQSGFREASHITRHMTIEWNRNSLLNLVARRAVQNPGMLAFYGTTRDTILASTTTQQAFFYQVSPEQVDVGPNKPSTFDWMLTRTRDGTQRNAPRELIHLLNSLRDQQVRRLEIGEAEPEGRRLFARAAFKDALPEVSRTRLEQTLYAEYPSLRPRLEGLRGEKSSQSTRSLATIWGVSDDEAQAVARELVEVGFFEERGGREAPEFWIPFLYRDALDLVQGAAD